MGHTRHSEQRIRFGTDTDPDHGRLGLIVDLRFPVVDLILLRDGQVGLYTTLGVEELDFCAPFHKAVCNLQLRLELPGGDTLLLNGEEL